MSLAPLWLRGKFLRLIQREISTLRMGKDGQVVAKMNSLCDKEIIANLYEASCAGVEIKLIVRGICCLKAGVPNLSENIEVRSIVGNFLEHSRIFLFENGGKRGNLHGKRRLDAEKPGPEGGDPVPGGGRGAKGPSLIHILDVQLADNVKAHLLQPDGTYQKEESQRTPEG